MPIALGPFEYPGPTISRPDPNKSQALFFSGPVLPRGMPSIPWPSIDSSC
jgi:hypothetical protein